MLAFQFDVHPTLMTVQVDMHRPQDINKAVVISFLGKSLIQLKHYIIICQIDN